MTAKELLEEIDTPMQANLVGTANVDADIPQTAREHHKTLRDIAEAEELSDCKTDPEVGKVDMGGGVQQYTPPADDELEDGSSPELLSPPMVHRNQSAPSIWTAIQELIHLSTSHME